MNARRQSRRQDHASRRAVPGVGRDPDWIACVDLPALPLQILRRERPELAGHPIAVVAEDRADAPLLLVDELGARMHLSPGMRYGAARNLVPSLRAAPVASGKVAAVVEELVVALQTFSPRVEPDAEREGVFFIDPRGLARIYGDPESWARAVHAYVTARGFRASVAVAHGRFPSFALARAHPGVRVMKDVRETTERLHAVPLRALGLTPRLRDDLAALAVTTLGDLLGLPEVALAARFGKEAARLRALAANDPQLLMQPRPFDEPITVTLSIEPPDDDHARLLFGIKGALHELLELVASRALTLRALRIELDLDDGGAHVELIEPASPTRDAMLILDLVRLRLAEVALSSPAGGIKVEALTAKPEGDQLAMFRTGPRRDLSAGERALARVRAAFGADSVTRARLRDAHLPEARYAWEPTTTLRLAKTPPEALDVAREQDEAPLVRRVLAKPRALAARDPEDLGLGPRLDGVLATEGASSKSGASASEVIRLFGPYRLSGGWWVRNVERDYYYAETSSGDLLWLYFDRPRRRWFLHGVVD